MATEQGALLREQHCRVRQLPVCRESRAGALPLLLRHANRTGPPGRICLSACIDDGVVALIVSALTHSLTHSLTHVCICMPACHACPGWGFPLLAMGALCRQQPRPLEGAVAADRPLGGQQHATQCDDDLSLPDNCGLWDVVKALPYNVSNRRTLLMRASVCMC